mgnify:CR=1 FL=1|jgi:hypothetical protein
MSEKIYDDEEDRANDLLGELVPEPHPGENELQDQVEVVWEDEDVE